MENSSHKVLFFDKLNFSSFIFLLGKRLPKKLVLLEMPNPSYNIYFLILKLFGYHISEESFFAGHVQISEGESAYMAATYSARRIAVAAALELLQTNKLLNEVNVFFDRNTLQLHLTKQLVSYIRYWTERIHVVRGLAGNNDFILCIAYPDRINPNVIKKEFTDATIIFYTVPWFAFFSHLKKVKSLYLELFRFFLFPFNGKKRKSIQIPSSSSKPGVLAIQEDTIRADLSFRGQPHWFDFQTQEKRYNTYIIKSTHDTSQIDDHTKKQFENNNIFLIEQTSLKEAFKSMRKHRSLLAIIEFKKKILWQFFLPQSYKNKYFLIRTALFLKQAEYMGSLSLWFNIKVFLFRESYIPLTDAIQLIGKSLNVKTIAYQYSNLGVYSPVMMNTADLMLLFSNSFKKVLSDNFFSSQVYKENGYLYDRLNESGRKRAFEIRAKLQTKGANFIVSFFDESVQHDKWGLVNKSDHLFELHALAQAVINDNSMGVVVKSQFLENTPSRLYLNDPILSNASATGRFIELHTGSGVRNDIFPSEVGLISDIAIGHKFGATASLEVAIEGVKSVMIDKYRTKTNWDFLYDNPLITFPSIEDVLHAINHYRHGNVKFKDIGDWSSFLKIFTTNHKDEKSTVILRDLIEKECLASK